MWTVTGGATQGQAERVRENLDRLVQRTMLPTAQEAAPIKVPHEPAESECTRHSGARHSGAGHLFKGSDRLQPVNGGESRCAAARTPSDSEIVFQIRKRQRALARMTHRNHGHHSFGFLNLINDGVLTKDQSPEIWPRLLRENRAYPRMLRQHLDPTSQEIVDHWSGGGRTVLGDEVEDGRAQKPTTAHESSPRKALVQQLADLVMGDDTARFDIRQTNLDVAKKVELVEKPW